MCGCLEKQARSYVGVHSFVVELTSLEIQPFHLLSILINPNVDLDWMNFDVYLDMCEPGVFPLLLVEIMPSSRVAVLLRD